jgi:hypothetical protein
MARCQEATEQDRRVRDPEAEEVGEPGKEQAGVAWAATGLEPDPTEIAFAPPAGPRFRISEAAPVLRLCARNADARW